MLGTDKAWEMFDELEETYFNQKPEIPELSPQLQVLINLEMAQKEQDRKIEATNKRIDDMRNVVSLSSASWRRDTSQLISKMARQLGGNEHIKDLRAESYQLLDERLGVCLSIRLANLRCRMAQEGISRAKRDKKNFLDVIDKDKKLIEGYVAIVKEMAIKYGIAA